MRTSELGKKFLISLEGLKLKAYLDSAGIPTIGVGSLDMPSGKKVKMGDTITQAEAMQLLSEDLERFERAVSSLVKTTMTQNQFDALVCFVFNIGEGAFKSSTLLKELNAGRPVDTQWVRWNRAGGKVVQGLINRRNRELNLYKVGDYGPT